MQKYIATLLSIMSLCSSIKSAEQQCYEEKYDNHTARSECIYLSKDSLKTMFKTPFGSDLLYQKGSHKNLCFNPKVFMLHTQSGYRIAKIMPKKAIHERYQAHNTQKETNFLNICSGIACIMSGFIFPTVDNAYGQYIMPLACSGAGLQLINIARRSSTSQAVFDELVRGTRILEVHTATTFPIPQFTEDSYIMLYPGVEKYLSSKKRTPRTQATSKTPPFPDAITDFQHTPSPSRFVSLPLYHLPPLVQK